MNLPEMQEKLAGFLAGNSPELYLNLSQRKLCAQVNVSTGCLQNLMTRCGYKLYRPFLNWCASGKLRWWLEGTTPEQMDTRELDAALRKHREVAGVAIIVYTRKRNGSLGKCTKCGTRREPRFYRPSGPVCLTCAGVHEAAGITWDDYGRQVDRRERVQLEKIDGSRIRKQEVA